MATATAGSNSRFVLARIARELPSSGQVRTARARRTVSSDASGARISRPSAAGPDAIRLANRSPVVFHEPDRALHDRPRTAVVHLQVDPSKVRETVVQGKDPPNVGEAPAVDGLVVIADQEDPVRRCGQEQRQVQLGAVHILDLVDQQLPTSAAPPGEEAGLALQGRDGAEDQVVEVESSGGCDRSFVVHEGSRRRSRLRVGGDLGRGRPATRP